MLPNRIDHSFSFILLTLCFKFLVCHGGHRRPFNSLPVQRDKGRNRLQPNTNWNPQPRKSILKLKFMTFNTFHSARTVHNGMKKLADHILEVNPDIVALQEINQTVTDVLVGELGTQWKRCSKTQKSSIDVSIITKSSVSRTYSVVDGFSNIGCQVLLQDNPKTVVNVWNVHLNYRDYGPYKACIQPIANDVKDLISKEYTSSPSRVDSIIKLLNHPSIFSHRFNTEKELQILAGDFNVPSTLDWTEQAKGLHCNWVCDWPVSRLLLDHGFIDSYRKVFPNPLSRPGITWSPITMYHDKNKIYLEPRDRIDYIYYKSRKMNAVMSRTYTGTRPLHYIPNNYRNDWPSDHAAVITDFDITL